MTQSHYKDLSNRWRARHQNLQKKLWDKQLCIDIIKCNQIKTATYQNSPKVIADCIWIRGIPRVLLKNEWN